MGRFLGSKGVSVSKNLSRKFISVASLLFCCPRICLGWSVKIGLWSAKCRCESYYSQYLWLCPNNYPSVFAGYYVYIETSWQSANNTAILESAVVSTAGKPQSMICLRFWYHMYGQHVDTLSLFLKRGQQLPSSPTWIKSGTQGNQWRLGQVAVKSLTPFQVELCYCITGMKMPHLLSFRLRPRCSKHDWCFIRSHGLRGKTDFLE